MNDTPQFDAELLGQRLTFSSTYGLFSPEGIDAGTKLLLNHIGEIPEDASVLDLGCGYGPIGVAIAKQGPERHVTMVDTNFVAVEYANKNAEANGTSNAEAMLSDGFAHLPEDARFDLVVSNLPAKIGRDLTLTFFNDAQERLNPGGRIVVVTVKGLKEFVKRSFKETFGGYKKLKQGEKHVVTQAVKE